MRCDRFGGDRDGLPFVLSEVQADFTSDYRLGLSSAKGGADTTIMPLAFTSILRGAHAGLYPLLDLNSVEPPIGPNSERGYFAAFEQLINGRRMNFQKLGHFFYG
jgi:hypothetical protein